MKVISGGQTGSDLGGLQGAKLAGVETGGTAPRGYRTESGPNLELSGLYGLRESRKESYRARTEENVVHSDATVIFADDMGSPGTKLTISLCKQWGKPFFVNPTARQLRNWVLGDVLEGKEPYQVLNVAGNRESVAPGIQNRVCAIVAEALGGI